MTRLRLPATLFAAAALALTMSACGSGSAEGTSTPTTGSSASQPSDANSPAPTNSGIVPENTWAGVVKKAVAPLAEKSDEDVVAAAKKVCSTFEANPDEATAKAILTGNESALGLDHTQSVIFASAAVTHFCTPQTEAWTKASIG
ncbi:DUF732 domain-containing protein [Knoellia subterranea]|uniref:DUF732 domain-containing protein n=1 Tax=Knoellia subterranea KCTC 19937 TaxID=1385521 RepID=A0A0A0JRU3_9MICO|nr:DUF732 domain-containing protein [Knoellia subterranea]KGN38326.1 hypothetical protein N803_09970 [Knoellia subterranea KCTC 19937]